MTRMFSGRRLREVRVAAGVSTERLALGIVQSSYSIHEYERGRVAPPVNVLSQAAYLLGCKVDDFLCEEEVSRGAGPRRPGWRQYGC